MRARISIRHLWKRSHFRSLGQTARSCLSMDIWFLDDQSLESGIFHWQKFKESVYFVEMRNSCSRLEDVKLGYLTYLIEKKGLSPRIFYFR